MTGPDLIKILGGGEHLYLTVGAHKFSRRAQSFGVEMDNFGKTDLVNLVEKVAEVSLI